MKVSIPPFQKNAWNQPLVVSPAPLIDASLLDGSVCEGFENATMWIIEPSDEIREIHEKYLADNIYPR